MPDSFQQPQPERRSPDRPCGLPIFCTEPLSTAERQKLLDLQERYQRAALAIELCLRIDKVDEALATLQFLTRDVDGVPATIALTLGSNR